MKIRTIGIKGFRGYSSPIQVEVSDLLVLVGKNDIGKSTMLEALDIFFNDGKGSVKLDKEDMNKANLAAGDDCIEFSVEFEELPASIVIGCGSFETTVDDVKTRAWTKAVGIHVTAFAASVHAASCSDSGIGAPG